MGQYDLSVLIPARNEEFLRHTIEDVVRQRRAHTQVVVLLDGAWPVEPIPAYPDVMIQHRPVSIGQRAATNVCARVATGEWIMKLDAHCRVGEGFDQILIENAEYENTYIPRQHNLHAFDWRCLKCGTRTYQGPQPTRCIVVVGSKEERLLNPSCDGTEFERVLVWEPWQRQSKVSVSWRFDNELHYQNWGDYAADEETCRRHGVPFRPETQGDIIPTMSCLGACWFLSRERYFDLGGMDEAHGSWGQMGTEVACKTWLSGGQLLCNKKTWYAHLFRTQPGFEFPYPISHKQTAAARVYSKNLWRNGQWSKAIHPLSWLVEKFWPVVGWEQADLDLLKATERGQSVVVAPEIKVKARHVASAARNGRQPGIAYYTDNRCPEPILSVCQEQIKRAAPHTSIVSTSLAPIDFGDNYVLNLERGWLTLFRQILMCLSQLDTDYAFLCEHDCLYPPEHFEFVPPRRDRYYYNEAIWRVSAVTGHALFHYRRSVMALVANRRLLIDHYRERIARVEKEGFKLKNGFEPGTRSIRRYGYDDIPAESFFSSRPIIDIRDTGTNATKTNWKKEDFRYERYTAGWTEAQVVPGWGRTEGRFPEFLEDVRQGRIH